MFTAAQVDMILGYARDGLKVGCELPVASVPSATDRMATRTKEAKEKDIEPQLLDADPGVQRISFLIDWLALTIWSDVATVLRLVAVHFLGAHGDEDDFERFFERREYGARFYKELRCVEGINVYSDFKMGGGHCHVEIKGEALQGLSLDDLRRFLVHVDETVSRWSCPRVDATWDNCPFTVKDFDAAVQAREFRSVVKRDEDGWTEYHRSTPSDLPGERVKAERSRPCGESVYVGRRSSNRQLVCYNGRGFTRLEFRQKDEWGSAAVLGLIKLDVSKWSAFCLGLVRQFIDFVDRGDDSNMSRRSKDDSNLKGWWREFLGGAVRAGVVACRRKAAAIFRGVAKLGRSVRAKLAAAVDVLGVTWLMDEMEFGRLDEECRVKYESWKARFVSALAADADHRGDEVPLTVAEMISQCRRAFTEFCRSEGEGESPGVWA